MIKVEENGRKAVFRNPANLAFSVVHVDGCLITDGQRCDYMVSKDGDCSVLIELKGKNVEHAVKQLEVSAGSIKIKKMCEAKVGFLIVCSQFPRFNTFVARAKSQFAKKYGAGLHVVCNKAQFDIERVVAIDGPN